MLLEAAYFAVKPPERVAREQKPLTQVPYHNVHDSTVQPLPSSLFSLCLALLQHRLQASALTSHRSHPPLFAPPRVRFKSTSATCSGSASKAPPWTSSSEACGDSRGRTLRRCVRLSEPF